MGDFNLVNYNTILENLESYKSTPFTTFSSMPVEIFQ